MTTIVCGRCYDVCPVECFWQDEKMLYIDPAVCVDCEACIPECPVEAIWYEYNHKNIPEQWRPFIEINADRATRLKEAGPAT